MRAGVLVTLVAAAGFTAPLLSHQLTRAFASPETAPSSAAGKQIAGAPTISEPHASAESVTAYENAQAANQNAQAEKTKQDAVIEKEQFDEKHATNITSAWISIASSLIITVFLPLVVTILILLSSKSIIAAFAKGGWNLALPGGLSISVQQLTTALTNSLAQPPALPISINQAGTSVRRLSKSFIAEQTEEQQAKLTAAAEQAKDAQNSYFRTVAGTILSSQLQLLIVASERRSMSIEEAQQIFKATSQQLPLPFETWLNYLIRFDLVTLVGKILDMLAPTDVGKSFVEWASANGVTVGSLSRSGK